jgi:PKD repeat protein
MKTTITHFRFFFTIVLLCISAASFSQQFPCDGKLYFFRYSNGQNWLSYVDGYLTATPVVADVCTLSVTGQNALGANPIDHLIYFTAQPNNTVYRMDVNCNTTVICTNVASTTKGCFDYLGRYWIIDNLNNMLAYDLNTCTQVEGPYPLPQVAGIDFVFSSADCHFYMADQNTVLQIDTNGIITGTFTPGFSGAGSYGGLTIGADGNLYGIPNNSTTGELYMYNLSTFTPGPLVYSFPEGTANPCGCDMASFPCPTLISDFTATPSTGCQPLTVQFTNTSQGLVSSWHWDFGDSTYDTVNYNPSHTYTQPGIYTVTLIVNATSNCLLINPDTFTMTVQVFALPVAGITGISSICVGDSSQLTASGGINYEWSTNDTTASISVSPAATTVYTATVTDANGCSASASFIVNVNPLPLVVSPSAPVICSGGSVTLTMSGAANYHWSPSGGIISANGPDSTSVTVSLTQTTCYTVTGYSVEGCSATTSFCVTVNPNPAALIVPSGPIVFCAGGSVDLMATPSGEYLWSTIDTVQNITVNANGTFTVTVTDANGCIGVSPPVTVTVNPNPQPVINPVGPITICEGNPVLLTCLPGNPGDSYLWSDFSSSQTLNVVVSGNYTVTVTDINGCSGVSSPVAVTIYPNPQPWITVTDSTLCEGETATISCGTLLCISSYIWNSNATTPIIFVDSSGSYVLTVYDCNGCAGLSNVITVSVHPPPPAVITPAGPITICSNNPALLSANTGNGYTYQWYRDSIIIPGATSDQYNALVTGIYSVLITDVNGCTAVSNNVQVTQGTGPIVSIASPPTTGCTQNTIYIGYGPQSIELCAETSAGAVSYLWSTNDTTQCINVTQPGTYSVIAFDINGCPSPSPGVLQPPINVIDIRCGHGLKKILICHVPEGNPGNPQTLCIGPPAVPPHLEYHRYDCLGPCSLYYRENEIIEENDFFVYPYPNPFSNGFNLLILSTSENSVTVNIHDMLGRIVEKYTDVTENTVLGETLNRGIYFTEIMQGENRQIIPIIKQE